MRLGCRVKKGGKEKWEGKVKVGGWEDGVWAAGRVVG